LERWWCISGTSRLVEYICLVPKCD
jgi:hypothetical protein